MVAVAYPDQTRSTLVADDSGHPTPLARQNLPVPDGFEPEGVAEACIDETTLYLVQSALPPRIGGRDLFVHLLYYATLDPKTTMQYSLFHATGEASNEAIVLITSVNALAKSPGSKCGRETYHKALLVIEALGVIRRIFHRTYTEIRIPLGKREIHLPTLLASLRHLHDEYRNPKVKQLAKKVAKRLQSGEFATFRTSEPVAVMPELKQVLTTLLQRHGIKEGNIQTIPLHQACEIIAQLMLLDKVSTPPARLLEAKGEFPAGATASTCRTGTRQGESNERQGVPVDPRGEKCLDLPSSSRVQGGEFAEGESPHVTRLSLDQHHRGSTTSPSTSTKGDAVFLFSMESPKNAQSGSIGDVLGDSKATVSVSGPSFCDITHYEDTTLTDGMTDPAYKDPRPLGEIQHEAASYALLFDGQANRKWMGKFVECIKKHPPHIRRLAAIDTLYHTYFPDWRRKPYSPGAWFNAACDRYAGADANISHAVRLWAETDCSFEEIERALQQGQHLPEAITLPLVKGRDEPTDFPKVHEPGALGRTGAWEAAKAGPVPMLAQGRRHVPHDSQLRTWMNKDAAERLLSRIQREGRLYGIQAVVRPGSRQGFVVVTTWDGVSEEMASGAEWGRYFASVKECLSLSSLSERGDTYE
jgi:hypothetical protein